MTLPLFLSHKNKYLTLLILFVVATCEYLTSNHYHIFDPIYLPMTRLDSMIPFIPQTIWIYMTEYLLFLMVFFMSKDYANCNKYLYAFFFQQTIAVAIFWFWPTTYPRHLFPLPEELDALSYYIFSGLRTSDSPANCCPSLHVSSVFLSSFVFLKEQQKKFPYFFVWAILIALSTLTTKQHYIVDVVTGFLLAAVTYWVTYNLIKFVPVKSFDAVIESRPTLNLAK
jgi:membrane-associated phospholipid phosphatase